MTLSSRGRPCDDSHPTNGVPMQRFEFNDGKSNKFWEITVEGDSFTVRYGRMGTDGQTSTKTYADAGKARAEADKLIAKKTKKGYTEVAVDAAAAAKNASVTNKGGGNPKLEAPIFANPEDLDAWSVYGDWLQEEGDPRGELVSLEVEAARGNDNAAAQKRRAELLAEHENAWLGKKLVEAIEMQNDGDEVLEIEWKLGFIHKVTLRANWDFGGEMTVPEMFRELIKLESFKFVNEIVFGCTDLEGETDFDDVMLPLSKVGKLPSIRRLTVGEYDYEEQELTWVKVGNCGRLWPVLPNLEFFKARGGGISLGKLEHEHLEELVLETAGLPKDAVKSLAAAKLPSLVKLDAWIGNEERSEEHGEHSDIDDLKPLLTGVGVPKLKHLGLKNCDYQDDIAVALATAPIVAQLETLDLSMGVMAEAGAQAVIEHSGHFAHLSKIDLSDNCIDDAEVAALQEKFGDKVDVDGQEPSEDEDDRYISVSE